MNLAEALDTNALRRPDRPAIIAGGRIVSHAAFRDAVCRWAAYLDSLGIRRNDIVGVNLKDTPEHLMALFALARLGAAALPMDWRWTLDEKSRLATFFKPKIVLSEPEDVFGGHPGAWRPIAVDNDWHARTDETAPAVAAPADGDPPLLLALSSGTTGIPKGPLITHGQFFARFMIYFATLGFSERTRYLCATPLYFGGSRGYSMCAIYAGGTAILFPPPYEMGDLLACAADHRATKTFLVPTLLRRLLDLPPPGNGELLLPGLDMLFSTGAALHPEEREALMRNACPRYVNFYGSTDGGGATALFWDDPPGAAASVGRPVFGAEIGIVDDSDSPVSAGEVGRIRYRHPGTATGYHNDTAASGEAFRNGWYYPGDLGWLDEAGYLFLAGRAKDMIIRGGVNIYPAEIEHVLAQHDDVIEAAVVGAPSRALGEDVAAFVVCREPAPSTEALTEWCNGRLAPYKVPRRILLVDDLPKSGVGKILKTELVARLSET